MDDHVCMVLKNTIQSSLKQNFRAYKTCSEVLEECKLLYTNDTQCLMLFVTTFIFAFRDQDPMVDYVA